jgi:hypothetical protein
MRKGAMCNDAQSEQLGAFQRVKLRLGRPFRIGVILPVSV